MKTLSNPEKAYSYHLYGSGEDGLVTFVLSVPISSLQAFIDFADHRKKIYTAPSRVPPLETVEQRNARVQVFNDAVLKFFDSFIKQGSTRNEAISKANKAIKEKHSFASYDIVKNVVLKFRKVK